MLFLVIKCQLLDKIYSMELFFKTLKIKNFRQIKSDRFGLDISSIYNKYF